MANTFPKFLCDPYVPPPPYAIKRILGNVGKPGITILVPPTSQMIRSIDPGAWKVSNYARFDGTPEDHFDRTAVNLSFTQLHQPVFDGMQGRQDSEVFFLESVVSVFDHGKWVADIDIAAAMKNPMVRRMPSLKHNSECKGGSKPTIDITCVDSWDEVLDPPDEPFVVRANNNWIGRLAVISVLEHRLRLSPKRKRSTLSRNRRNLKKWITICPREVCWECGWASKGSNEGLDFNFRPEIFVY